MSSFHYEGQGVWVSYEEESDIKDDISSCSSSSIVSENESQQAISLDLTDKTAQEIQSSYSTIGGKHPPTGGKHPPTAKKHPTTGGKHGFAYSIYQYLEEDEYNSDLESTYDSEPDDSEHHNSQEASNSLDIQEAPNSFDHMPHSSLDALKLAYSYRFSNASSSSEGGVCSFLKELEAQCNGNYSRAQTSQAQRNDQIEEWLEKKKQDGIYLESDDESDSSQCLFGRESSQSIMKRVHEAGHERAFLSSVNQSEETALPEYTLKRKRPARNTLQVPGKASKHLPPKKRARSNVKSQAKVKEKVRPQAKINKKKAKQSATLKIKKEKPKPDRKDPEFPLPAITENVIIIQIDRKEHSKVRRWEKAYTPKEENFIMWAVNHPDGPMSWEWIAKMIFPFSGRPNKDDPNDTHEYRVYRTSHSVRVRWTDNIGKGKYVDAIVKDEDFIMQNYQEFYQAYPLERMVLESEEE